MRWVTRERPKIDRIACPWLIARFIDQAPEFLYVPSGDVLRIANETGAIPYDIPVWSLRTSASCAASMRFSKNIVLATTRPCGNWPASYAVRIPPGWN